MPPGRVGWAAPVVIGKSDDWVCPVTMALPGIKPVTGNVTLVCPAGTVADVGACKTVGALFVFEHYHRALVSFLAAARDKGALIQC